MVRQNVLLVLLLIVVLALCCSCTSGESSACSTRAYSFGNNWYGQLGDGTQSYFVSSPVAVLPSGVLSGRTIVAAAASDGFSLVLSTTGEVFGFGSNGYGQLGDGTWISRFTPVAVDTSGVLNGTKISAIAVGSSHSLVLADSGHVFSFGRNDHGELGDGTNTIRNRPVAVYMSGVLDGLNATAIAAGHDYSLVLADNGQAFSFGRNDFGQLGDNTTISRFFPVAVISSGMLYGLNITGIAAGHEHSLVLSESGQVFGFGWNNYGQLGDGTSTDSRIPVAVNMSGVLSGHNITALSAGYAHSLVLSESGQVFSFGYNSHGQLGDNTTSSRNQPVFVNTSSVLGGGKVSMIAAGRYHSLIASESRKAFSFGYNSNGRLGDATTTSRHAPVSLDMSGVLNGVQIAGVSAGEHSLVWSANGQAYGFGQKSRGELGDGGAAGSNVALATSTSDVLNGLNIVAVAANYMFSLVLSATGKVFSFGLNGNGQLGDGTRENRFSPVAVNTSGVLSGHQITAIAAGNSHSLVLSESGQVFSFGYNNFGQLGNDSYSYSALPIAVSTPDELNDTKIIAISAGAYHSIVLSESGQPFSFGYNAFGQLGDGSWTTRYTPVAVNTSNFLDEFKVTAIAAGEQHSLLLLENGQVFSFGYNHYGQLGDGTDLDSPLPVAVDTSGVLYGVNISAISAASRHSIVLSANGSVYTFGSNGNGQLGDGTYQSSWVPVAVNSSLEFVAISAWYRHSLMLTATGQVFAFGRNDQGQLGDGSFTDRANPVEISTTGVLTGLEVSAISAGFYHSIVVAGSCDESSSSLNAASTRVWIPQVWILLSAISASLLSMLLVVA